MDKVDAKLVMELHHRTGMPVMMCKSALEVSSGDMDAAAALLHRRCHPIGGGCPAPRPGFWEQFHPEPSIEQNPNPGGTTYESELEAALDAARLAAEALREAYARFQAIPDAPASISTDADRQSQEIILGHLQRTFPLDAYCAEEQTPALAKAAHTGARLWVIDPIDGTRGFARKNGEFSVMIGFVDRGQIALGVVHQPIPNRLTYGVRGQGCWKRDGEGEPVPCRVTEVTELRSATLTQSHSTPGKRSRRVELLAPGRVVESYSAGIKLALVARGEADLYVNTYPEFHDWDSCAGQILVEEAGGRVTGLGGEELRYGLPGAAQRYGLLATNGRLHDEAMKLLASTRSG